MITEKLNVISCRNIGISHPSQWEIDVWGNESERHYGIYVRYRSRFFYAMITDGLSFQEKDTVKMSPVRQFLFVACLPEETEESYMTDDRMKELLSHQFLFDID